MITNELIKGEQTTKAWQEDQALARFQMISPLLDESLDQAKRVELREQLSAQYQVSTRSLYRYENYYRKNGFSDLKPMLMVNKEAPHKLRKSQSAYTIPLYLFCNFFMNPIDSTGEFVYNVLVQ